MSARTAIEHVFSALTAVEGHSPEWHQQEREAALEAIAALEELELGCQPRSLTARASTLAGHALAVAVYRGHVQAPRPPAVRMLRAYCMVTQYSEVKP